MRVRTNYIVYTIQYMDTNVQNVLFLLRSEGCY